VPKETPAPVAPAVEAPKEAAAVETPAAPETKEPANIETAVEPAAATEGAMSATSGPLSDDPHVGH
jgi:hypothetical protein